MISYIEHVSLCLSRNGCPHWYWNYNFCWWLNRLDDLIFVFLFVFVVVGFFLHDYIIFGRRFGLAFTEHFLFRVCLSLYNFTLSLRHAFKNKNYFNERKRTCARDRVFWIWICGVFDMKCCCDSSVCSFLFYFFLLLSSFDVLHIHTVVVSLIKRAYTYASVTTEAKSQR